MHTFGSHFQSVYKSPAYDYKIDFTNRCFLPSLMCSHEVWVCVSVGHQFVGLQVNAFNDSWAGWQGTSVSWGIWDPTCQVYRL